MAQASIPRRFFSPADILVFFVIGTAIYGIFLMSVQWRADFHPVTDIDLSLGALPRYSLFSALRGLVAYIFSLLFTLVVGYAAAKSKRAEKILVPTLDILQSVPPLGFLPGLSLALITLFPRTNTGLELVCIITIFTGQVWNMTFSFYSSLKSVPSDFQEASTVMGLSWWQKLWRVELPFSAMGLAWNSLLSMAGGWFFLSVCEAFTLGDREFRLPGVGAYMAVAIEKGDTRAMVYGVLAMIFIIVALDIIIWHPILSWVRRFRLEEVEGAKPDEPLMSMAFRESRLFRTVRLIYRRAFRSRMRAIRIETKVALKTLPILAAQDSSRQFSQFFESFSLLAFIIAGAGLAFGTFKLFKILAEVPLPTWGNLLQQALLTLSRVIGALILSTLWALPVGIWIGTSQKRIRIAQPIIQVLASFPAPMLYPLALTLCFTLGMSLNIASMFLMLMGVQWYVLFNVLAGSLRISPELGYTCALMNISRWDKWKTLYIPSVFPALVTGWVTAAGGAWNASIVAEYLSYKGKILTSHGLGAAISVAAAAADYHTLAASLTLMVVVVLILNRGIWSRVYALAQTRFRMDM